MLRKEDYYLLLIFISFSITICLRVLADDNSYTSPDSEYYLDVCKNIYSGKGVVTQNPYDYPIVETDPVKPFTLWPMGYPALILIAKYITGTSFLISSKIINILCFGILLLTLRFFDKKNAWFYSLSFFSISSITIYTYSWSEAPFITLLILYLVLLNTLIIDFNKLSLKSSLFIGLILSLLFLMRYVGIVFLLFHFCFFLFLFLKKKLPMTKHNIKTIFLSLLIPSFVIIGYAIRNYLADESLFGTRGSINNETLLEYLLMGFKGIVMELFIARKYFFHQNEDIILFTFFGTIQLLFSLLIHRKSKQHQNIITNRQINMFKTLFTLSFFYIFFIYLLRYDMNIENLTLRFFAPSSSILLLSLFFFLKNYNPIFFNNVKKLIISFMLLSLLISLPKKFLIDYFQTLFTLI